MKFLQFWGLIILSFFCLRCQLDDLEISPLEDERVPVVVIDDVEITPMGPTFADIKVYFSINGGAFTNDQYASITEVFVYKNGSLRYQIESSRDWFIERDVRRNEEICYEFSVKGKGETRLTEQCVFID